MSEDNDTPPPLQFTPGPPPTDELHIGLAQTLVTVPYSSVLYVDAVGATLSLWVPATSEVVDQILPEPDPVTGATRTIVISAPAGSTRA